MTKIAYNACYGGFGLSYKGVMRYAEIKGITLYASVGKRDDKDNLQFGSYRPYDPAIDRELFCVYHIASETDAREHPWYASNLERDDPVLIQVIEELGDEANARFAALRIEEVPKGKQYRIDEYDGNESVMTIDSYVWKTA